MNNIVFIHIGKCAGCTIREELKSHNIQFKELHWNNEIEYDPNKKYIISIRNPIQRFISAFYWRYHLVCETKKQENRFKGEKDLLQKYKNVDNLANDILEKKVIFNDTNQSGNYIHHLREDINYYLHNLIDSCSKENILGVICTETIKDDMKLLFDINITKHVFNNKKYDKTISQKSYQILKEYLKKDYDIIKKMYDKGIINSTKFNFLSK